MTDNKMYMGAGQDEDCSRRKPECDLATEKAINMGRDWKNELEKAALIANNSLQQSLATLAQSMTTTNNTMKELAETVKVDHEIVVESQRQWREMQEWQRQESVRHTKEETEKKTALAKVETERETAATNLEQERKDRIKPFTTIWVSVLDKVIWVILTIAAIAIWQTYFGGPRL